MPQKSGDQKNGGKKNDESGASGSRDKGVSKATASSGDAKKEGEARVETRQSGDCKSRDGDVSGPREGGDGKSDVGMRKDDARLGGVRDVGKGRSRSEDAVSRFDPLFFFLFCAFSTSFRCSLNNPDPEKSISCHWGQFCTPAPAASLRIGWRRFSRWSPGIGRWRKS